MYVAKKTWFFWHAAVRRMPSDREHAFFRGGKSTSYEHVCLVTTNSGQGVDPPTSGGCCHDLGSTAPTALPRSSQPSAGFSPPDAQPLALHRHAPSQTGHTPAPAVADQ